MFRTGQSLSCPLLVKWASCTQQNPVTGLWHSDCVWMIPKGCCCNCIQIYHPLPCSECHQKTPDLEQLSDIFPESQARVWRPGNPPRSRHTEHPLSPLLLGNRNRHFFTPNWANLIFISHLGHGPSKQMLFFFFLPQTDFLTLWFHSWFATIFVQRVGLQKMGTKKLHRALHWALGWQHSSLCSQTCSECYAWFFCNQDRIIKPIFPTFAHFFHQSVLKTKII